MVKHKFFKKYIQIPLARAFKNLTARRSFLGVVFFLLTTLIVATNFIPKTLNFEPGDVSNLDIPSPRDLTFTSQVETAKAREEAIREVKPVFRMDKTVLEELEQEVGTLFAVVRDIQLAEGEEHSLEEQVEVLAEQLPFFLEEELALRLLAFSPEEITAMEQFVITIIRQNLRTGFDKELIPEVAEQIIEEIKRLSQPEVLKKFALGVIDYVEIRPTLVFDAQATQQEIEARRLEVPPVQVTVRKNQMIVRPGDIVTELHIEIFEQLGLQRSDSPYAVLVGIALIVGLSYTVVILYIRQYKKLIYNSDTSLVLTGLLIVLTLGLAKVVKMINFAGDSELSVQVGYMIPLAAGSMLITILLDTKLAVFLTIIMGLLIGILSGGQLSFVVTAVMGGLVGVYSVSRLSGRSDLVKAGLYVAGASVVSVIGLGLINNNSFSVVSVGIIMGLLNGILSAVLTIGLLPFLETAFGVTTSVKLLELSNPNHPLLKRLLIEAPGTYHHSIMAGNLAEAAADQVGADSLLVRVGAYFHDIGKLKRPYFFIENQLAGDNPHDKLAPTLSTLIITSHTKDGVELAKEHQLPPVIVDMVEQHHGVGLMTYFFHKASEGEKGETFNETDFRYDGPKPQTKEAALVMLGDSVEAAVRAMQNPTPGRVEGLVRKIIKEKLSDGQLDECDVTLRDLEQVTQAFLRVLNGIFHSRIEYPETIAKEMERRRPKSGVNSTQ
ncbi:MAG: HDIG domain-containing protein [Clostridia bacterium]|nr:HDIG domain-containing protein [Clostridia bacterium]